MIARIISQILCPLKVPLKCRPLKGRDLLPINTSLEDRNALRGVIKYGTCRERKSHCLSSTYTYKHSWVRQLKTMSSTDYGENSNNNTSTNNTEVRPNTPHLKPQKAQLGVCGLRKRAPCCGSSDLGKIPNPRWIHSTDSQLHFSYFAWRSSDLENGVGDGGEKRISLVPVGRNAVSGIFLMWTIVFNKKPLPQSQSLS